MRYEFLLSMALLLALFSCEDQNTLNNLNGSFEGTLVEIKQSLLNGKLTSTELDSIPLNMDFSKNTFERITAQLTCPGDVIVKDGVIHFDSDDCDCHCDCSPFVDCQGDLILGEYTYRWSANTLFLNFELQIDTLRFVGSDYLGFRHQKIIELKKTE